ncbi:MAG: MotA/TolQ/ExbB proton channel family protein [Henriciella sp.]|nr:MotA/TolQ/ExbB proton channel family protein [Henriciella sp.]
MDSLFSPFLALYEMGGPVLMLLLAVSIFTLTVILLKGWQFRNARVNKGQQIRQAIASWDRGQHEKALSEIEASRHFLAPVIALGMQERGGVGLNKRLESEAEQNLMPMERGFRILDMVAQLAPLLGLLGTVIGMIEAFQALQDAGSQVDPAALAGGIWVALLTTAAGLTVAMPTSVALSWFEAQMDDARSLADYAFSVIGRPVSAPTEVEELAQHVA